MKTAIIGFIVSALVIGALYIVETGGDASPSNRPASTAPSDDLGNFK